MDAWKVQWLQEMLEHEIAKDEEHYGAHLSHWHKGTHPLTIDAGGLRALIEYYSQHNTNLDYDPGAEENKTWYEERWQDEDILNAAEDLEIDLNPETVQKPWIMQMIKKDAVAAFSDLSERNEALAQIVDDVMDLFMHKATADEMQRELKLCPDTAENVIWLMKDSEGNIYLMAFLEDAETRIGYPRYCECSNKIVTQIPIGQIFDDMESAKIYIYDNGTDSKEEAEQTGLPVRKIDGKWYYDPAALIEDIDTTVNVIADDRFTPEELFQRFADDETELMVVHYIHREDQAQK